MILYTPLPPESIFPYDYSFYSDLNEYKLGDMILQGKLRDGKIEIFRVISTDPEDYLNPALSPGRFVNPPLAHC